MNVINVSRLRLKGVGKDYSVCSREAWECTTCCQWKEKDVVFVRVYTIEVAWHLATCEKGNG